MFDHPIFWGAGDLTQKGHSECGGAKTMDLQIRGYGGYGEFIPGGEPVDPKTMISLSVTPISNQLYLGGFVDPL